MTRHSRNTNLLDNSSHLCAKTMLCAPPLKVELNHLFCTFELGSVFKKSLCICVYLNKLIAHFLHKTWENVGLFEIPNTTRLGM